MPKSKPERLIVRVYDGVTVIRSVRISVERVGPVWFQTGGPRKITLTATRRQLRVTKITVQAPSSVRPLGLKEIVLPLGYPSTVEKGDSLDIYMPERVMVMRDTNAA